MTPATTTNFTIIADSNFICAACNKTGTDWHRHRKAHAGSDELAAWKTRGGWDAQEYSGTTWGTEVSTLEPTQVLRPPTHPLLHTPFYRATFAFITKGLKLPGSAAAAAEVALTFKTLSTFLTEIFGTPDV